MQARRSYFEGWYLLGATSLAMAALALWLASMRGFEVDGVRMVVRYTARTSLLFFCLAFGAAALARLWPNAWTRWQRRNRRYLGVTFAASHAIHAVAIVCFAVMIGFWRRRTGARAAARFCGDELRGCRFGGTRHGFL